MLKSSFLRSSFKIAFQRPASKSLLSSHRPITLVDHRRQANADSQIAHSSTPLRPSSAVQFPMTCINQGRQVISGSQGIRPLPVARTPLMEQHHSLASVGQARRPNLVGGRVTATPAWLSPLMQRQTSTDQMRRQNGGSQFGHQTSGTCPSTIARLTINPIDQDRRNDPGSWATQQHVVPSSSLDHSIIPSDYGGGLNFNGRFGHQLTQPLQLDRLPIFHVDQSRRAHLENQRVRQPPLPWPSPESHRSITPVADGRGLNSSSFDAWIRRQSTTQPPIDVINRGERDGMDDRVALSPPVGQIPIVQHPVTPVDSSAAPPARRRLPLVHRIIAENPAAVAGDAEGQGVDNRAAENRGAENEGANQVQRGPDQVHRDPGNLPRPLQRQVQIFSFLILEIVR